MFTGIIEEMGKVAEFRKKGSVSMLSLQCEKILEGTVLGDSINVNGVCLTVIKIKNKTVSFAVMKETLVKTNLQNAKKGELLNLERALPANGRFGGHFVSGHIDTTAKVIYNAMGDGSLILEIELPKGLRQAVVEKGSIAINGVSITIGKIKENSFVVYLIPHTLLATNLKMLRKNSPVNVEADMLEKFVKVHESGRVPRKSKITAAFLKEHGFI